MTNTTTPIVIEARQRFDQIRNQTGFDAARNRISDALRRGQHPSPADLAVCDQVRDEAAQYITSFRYNGAGAETALAAVAALIGTVLR